MKIIYRKWRKYMPSRMMKMLNQWHFNILGDKTIGFETKNRAKTPSNK